VKQAVIILLLLITCLCPLWGMRKALVIGNSNYNEQVLRNSINDASDVYNALKGLGFSASLFTDLNREGFFRAVGEFVSTLTPSDEVVFFYSGHAAQIEGKNYLIPVNEYIDSATRCAYLSYDTSMLLDELSRAAISIVILDACRDNPFAFSRSIRSGLAPMTVSAGSQCVIFATEQGRTASDGEGRNSPFTESLLANITTPGIKITDLIQRVSNEVAIKTQERQIPYSTGTLRQDFYFVKAEPVTPISPVIPPYIPQESKPVVSPSYGSIKVKTSFGGDLYIDGEFSQSLFAGDQSIIKDIAVGVYELKLVSPKETIIRLANVNKNQTTMIDFDAPDSYREEPKKIPEQQIIIPEQQIPHSEKQSIELNSITPLSPITKKVSVGTGALTIESPFAGDLYLGGDFIGKLTAKTSKKFSNVQAGSYTLEVMHQNSFCRKEIRIYNKDNLKLTLSQTEFSKYPDGFQYVSGGTFQMGTQFLNRSEDERPRHEVQILPFLMKKTEVEQKLWTDVMGYNPSEIKGDSYPVTNVSFYEAVQFCNALSILNGLTPCYKIDKSKTDPTNLCNLDTLRYIISCNWNASGYRLPTEAEWEYVSRCGDNYNKLQFSGSNNANDVAWNSKNSENKIHPVATKNPNQWGFYDLSGNVFEWCWDYYDIYKKDKKVHPKGAEKGVYRIARGGSFNSDIDACSSTARGGFAPNFKGNNLGFRIVRNVH